MEESIKKIEAPQQMKHREMEKFFAQGYRGAPTSEMRAAFANQWVKDLKHQKRDAVDSNFADEFRAWLCGNSRFNKLEHETTWADKPLFHIKGVRDYLGQELDMHWDFRKALIHLHTWGPKNLKEAYLYFKYIVCAYDWVQRKTNDDDPMAQIPPWYNRAGMIDFLDQYAMPPDTQNPMQNHPTSDVSRGDGRTPLPERENTNRSKFLEEHLALMPADGPGDSGGDDARNRDIRAAANARMYHESNQIADAPFVAKDDDDLLQAMIANKPSAVKLLLARKASHLYVSPAEEGGESARIQAAAIARAQAIDEARQKYQDYVVQTRVGLTKQFQADVSAKINEDYQRYQAGWEQKENEILQQIKAIDDQLDEYEMGSAEYIAAEERIAQLRVQHDLLEIERDRSDEEAAEQLLSTYTVNLQSPDPEIITEMLSKLAQEEQTLSTQRLVENREEMQSLMQEIREGLASGDEEDRQEAERLQMELMGRLEGAGYGFAGATLEQAVAALPLSPSERHRELTIRLLDVNGQVENYTTLDIGYLPEQTRARYEILLQEEDLNLQASRRRKDEQFDAEMEVLAGWDGGPAGYEQIESMLRRYGGAFRADPRFDIAMAVRDARLDTSPETADRLARLYLEHAEVANDQRHAEQLLRIIEGKIQAVPERDFESELSRNARAHNFLAGLEYRLKRQRTEAQQFDEQYLGELQQERSAAEAAWLQAEAAARERAANTNQLQQSAAAADVAARQREQHAQELIVGVLLDSIADLPSTPLTEDVRARLAAATDARRAATVIQELAEAAANEMTTAIESLKGIEEMVIENPRKTKEDIERLKPALEAISHAMRIIENARDIQGQAINVTPHIAAGQAEFHARVKYVQGLAELNKPREAGQEGANIHFGALVSKIPSDVLQMPQFWLGRGVKRSAIKPGGLRGVQNPAYFASDKPSWVKQINDSIKEYYSQPENERVYANKKFREWQANLDNYLVDTLSQPQLNVEHLTSALKAAVFAYPDVVVQTAAPLHAYKSLHPGISNAELVRSFANLYTDAIEIELRDGQKQTVPFLQPGVYRSLVYGLLFDADGVEPGLANVQQGLGLLTDEQRATTAAVMKHLVLLERLDIAMKDDGRIGTKIISEFIQDYMQATGRAMPENIKKVIYRPSAVGHPKHEKPARVRRQTPPQ